jgi:hypothetical protein
MSNFEVNCTNPDCSKNPNAGLGSDGRCKCCRVDGTAYWDAGSKTCKQCDGNVCGSNNGYCKGLRKIVFKILLLRNGVYQMKNVIVDGHNIICSLNV